MEQGLLCKSMGWPVSPRACWGMTGQLCVLKDLQDHEKRQKQVLLAEIDLAEINFRTLESSLGMNPCYFVILLTLLCAVTNNRWRALLENSACWNTQ